VSARSAYESVGVIEVEEQMNTFDSKSNFVKGSLAALVCALSLGLAACEKKGPLEQAGEEVDEAVDTIKNGGEESTSNKVDDAVDEARDGASDAADELKKD
jgi:predicted small lipoprotein YifL